MNSAGGGAALSTLGLIGELRGLGIASSIVCDEAGSPEERQALTDATRGEAMFTPLYWWNRKIRAATWKRPAIEARQLLRTRVRLGALGKVVHAARQWGAELVHTNTILTPEGGRAAAILGLGHVWHVRELIGEGQPFQLPLAGQALGRYLLAHASIVVANSHASGAAVQSLLPADRFEVVPNGIDLGAFDRFVPEIRPAPVVAMVANLTSRTKKHALFVAAARMVKGAQFRIYGHAPPVGRDAYADALREDCARSGVEVMGFQPADQVMASIDVLVHPADNESFGRTVVEAMASGLPVVGVRGGGVGETVVDGQTGLLARPDDPAELAAHLARLIANPALRAELGRAGRARARAEYSLAACAQRLALVYARAFAAPVGSGWTVLSLVGALR